MGKKSGALGVGVVLFVWAIERMWPAPPPYITYPLLWLALTLIIFAGLDWWGQRKHIKPHQGDMTAWEVLDYIMDGSRAGYDKAWEMYSRSPDDWVTRSDYAKEMLRVYWAAGEFEEAARQGQLNVSGRPKYQSGYQDISKRYWETSGLDQSAYYARHTNPTPSDGGKTEPKNISAGRAETYVGLRVETDEVRRLWPPISRFNRMVWDNMGIGFG